MASKQLGKLRQWAGEVISSRDKTVISDELQDLEKDIELRKSGIQKLLLASESYHHVLSKKAPNEALNETQKLLPVDNLGVVMIVHGEEFESDSTFGTSLVQLGRAHCQIAALQEAYALTFKDTFILSSQRYTAEIREYESLKKKLESRRLSYDAATSKYDKLKNSKKDKDKREAEDDLDMAKQRFEETAEDVRAVMHAIQENEAAQMRDLTSFLDLEINFVQQHLDVLQDVRSSWADSSPRIGNQKSLLSRSLSRAPKSKITSIRGKRMSHSDANTPVDGSDDDGVPRSHRSESNASKPPSRSTSRLSRKRTGSTTAEKEEAEKSALSSVTGWASSAVESVTSRSKKSKDKDQFSALNEASVNGNDGSESTLKKSRSIRSLSRRTSAKSKDNTPSQSPQVPPRILKPLSLQGSKRVRAVHPFSGSADELSFKAGDEIIVVNEVLDDWWMGELHGRRGLFPTTYTEIISSKKPDSSGLASNLRASPAYSDNEGGTSDSDDDRYFGSKPMSHDASPFTGGLDSDTASITHHPDEEVSNLFVVPPTPNENLFDDPRPKPTSRPRSRSNVKLSATGPEAEPLLRSTSENASSAARKVPPPPPPRRFTNPGLYPAPPLPERNAKSKRSDSSSSGSLKPYLSAPSSIHGYDTSPFESVSDLSHTECNNFKQNPFKPSGMCSNCFSFHE